MIAALGFCIGALVALPLLYIADRCLTEANAHYDYLSKRRAAFWKAQAEALRSRESVL